MFKISLLIVLLLSVLLVAVGCSGPETVKEPVATDDFTEGDAEKTPDFKTECEENAKKYPATIGSILVTKGNYDFTGMKYYFKGEIIHIGLIDNNVGDPSTWFVKNENGYVMPIQHDRFNADVGDTVEVWGTLSGNGYSNLEGVDNVVGETGSMHAFMVTVNGEQQY